MATSYKTPGVYIEEISSLPASVAQVETAIPAFIGYTEQYQDTDGTTLLNVPTRISSLVEFREKYGGAPPLNINQVNLNGVNRVTSIDLTDGYYMYDALRMFYANGGGDCYIVAVGKYSDAVIQNGAADGSTQGFLTGLEALKKADEPTLILSPDAVKMSEANVNSLYQACLTHANDMQDRFCVFDLREGAEDFDDAVSQFRSGIGVNYLKYGAAYTPWLKANLPRDVKYKDVKDKIYKSGTAVTLKSLADSTSDEAKFTADRMDVLVHDTAQVEGDIATLLSGTGSDTLQDRYTALYQAFINASSGTMKAKLQDLFNFYLSVFDLVDDWIDTVGGQTNTLGDQLSVWTAAYPTLPISGTFLYDYTKDFVNDIYRNVAGKLVDWCVEGEAEFTLGLLHTALTWDMDADANAWNNVFGTPPGTADPIFAVGANQTEKMSNASGAIAAIWPDILSGIEAIQTAAASIMDTTESSAKQQIPTLKTIVEAIGADLVTMPPSGAIVGIYAATDRNRGVWKAPANVSLSSTAGVKTIISHEKQENLNVDVTAGKSINAIRPFTGKGILVWGARTLAGNDNEWRYVPVRRLYLMVEESIKKATEFVVFEPNDANTWVRTKGMITNFLSELWKQGALAGAKPEQAFFVNVGLGETMTPQDILEGRMIIEIGMAAVRPAEFIILRFYHKLQEA